MLGVLPVQAQAVATLQQAALVRSEEGLFLTAAVAYEPSASVAEAVARSVPLYFVAQADVMRERWYWADQRVASASRTYRLAYQPLTRRWRVSVAAGAGPAGNLQYALHQNHDSLKQALAAVTRLYGWKVADADTLTGSGQHHLNFQFKLDMALLPRPFQLGMNAQTDWNIDLRRTLAVPAPETEKAAEAEGGSSQPLPKAP
jgi:Domain of unknown function (DUF4390)